MDEQKKQGKISRILKIVLISFFAFILLLAIIPKSSENWKGLMRLKSLVMSLIVMKWKSIN